MKENIKHTSFGNLVAFFRQHRQICDLCLAVFFAFVVCLFTCTSLSPLFPAENYDYMDGDSNLFRYMAWLWLQGKTPYLDFNDHKGLYHLAVDLIGLKIGGRYGIWFLEIVFSTINLFILAKCVRLLKGDAFRWRLLLYGLYFAMFSILSQGNSEGEWLLPFVNLYLYGYLNGLVKGKNGYFLLGSFFMGLEVGLALNSRPLDALWGGVGALYFIVYSIQKRNFARLFENAGLAIVGCAIPFAIFYPLAIQGGYFKEMIDAIFLTNNSYFLRQFTTFEILPLLNRLLVVAAVVYYLISFRLLRQKMANQKDLNFYFLFVGIGVSAIYLVVLGYFHYFQAGFGFFCLYGVYSISVLPPLKKYEWRKLITQIAFFGSVVYNLILVTGYYTVGIYDFSYWQSKQIETDVLSLPGKDLKTPGCVFAIDLDISVYLDGGIIVSERYMAYTTWWAQDNKEVVPEVSAYLSGENRPKWLLLPVQDSNLTEFKNVIFANYDFYSQPNSTFAIYLVNSVPSGSSWANS